MANSNCRGDEKIFEHNWVIKNWKEVVQNEALIESTSTEIDIKSGNQSFGKVLVGTSLDNKDCVGFYCKFLCGHQCLRDVRCDLLAEILKRDGSVGKAYSVTSDVLSGTRKQIVNRFWNCSSSDSTYNSWTTTDGSFKIRMKITMRNFPTASCFSKIDSMGSFRTEIIRNLAALLDDKSSSDIKILTKDKKELFAHQNILRAQSPVFASMFASDYLESSTGIINVDDISAKTMKILLTYWYTGELLPIWNEGDTVVEFTYAAGKYQITPVLKMLDDVLGCDFGVFDGDIELLKMTQKLSLKNAESRILKRVIHKIARCTNGHELLAMFDMKPGAFEEECLTAAKVAEAWNDTLNENDDKVASFGDIKFISLSCNLGLKNLENKFLKLIIGTINKVESSEELFAIFEGCQGQQADTSVVESSMSLDLLERVNPK